MLEATHQPTFGAAMTESNSIVKTVTAKDVNDRKTSTTSEPGLKTQDKGRVWFSARCHFGTMMQSPRSETARSSGVSINIIIQPAKESSEFRRAGLPVSYEPSTMNWIRSQLESYKSVSVYNCGIWECGHCGNKQIGSPLMDYCELCGCVHGHRHFG